MISVCWVYPDGTEHNASVEEGVNLMEAAIANDIESIYGECGGSMACATCHVDFLVICVPRSINRVDIFQCPMAQGAHRLSE